MEKLEEILFYTLEKSIKKYRQYAQSQIHKNNFDITIDQWLVLKTIMENNEIPQQQIAEKVFKDYASVTRIIEILVQKKFLKREVHPEDRRRFQLDITVKGEKIIEDIHPLVQDNRKKALAGISSEEVAILKKLLDKISTNCND